MQKRIKIKSYRGKKPCNCLSDVKATEEWKAPIWDIKNKIYKDKTHYLEYFTHRPFRFKCVICGGYFGLSFLSPSLGRPWFKFCKFCKKLMISNHYGTRFTFCSEKEYKQGYHNKCYEN